MVEGGAGSTVGLGAAARAPAWQVVEGEVGRARVLVVDLGISGILGEAGLGVPLGVGWGLGARFECLGLHMGGFLGGYFAFGIWFFPGKGYGGCSVGAWLLGFASFSGNVF